MRRVSAQLQRIITQGDFILVAGVLVVAVLGAHLTQAVLLLFTFGLFAGLYLVAARIERGLPYFQRRFILAAGVLLAAAAAFNFVMNPYGIYPLRLFRPIVLALRTEKMNLYSAREAIPQILVLGSSRTFTVDPQQLEQLWGYPAFNASVNAGSIYDSLAFTRFAIETRGAPKIIILNLEFDNFFPTNPRALEPDAYLWRYLDEESTFRPLITGWDHFTRLFTLQQLDYSLRQVRAELAGGWSGIYKVRADGMVSSPEATEPLKDVISRGLTEYRRIRWADIYQVSSIDPAALQLLYTLLELAKNNDIHVLGYVPPFHPQYLHYLDETSSFRALQGYMLAIYRQIGQNYPLQVIDFLDSDLFKTDTLDDLFWDGVHARETGSRLMMQALHDAFPKGF